LPVVYLEFLIRVIHIGLFLAYLYPEYQKKIFIVVFVCYYLSVHTAKTEEVYQLSNFLINILELYTKIAVTPLELPPNILFFYIKIISSYFFDKEAF
jgi:hypothetical protein